MTFRLIPTRAKPEGGFFDSWFLHGTEAEAVASAKGFFADWDVPVLVMRAGEGRRVRWCGGRVRRAQAADAEGAAMTTIAPERDTQPRRTEPPDQPLIHIERYRGSPIALCGYRFPYPDNPPLPWHRGPLDCDECWRIHRELEARGE